MVVISNRNFKKGPPALKCSRYNLRYVGQTTSLPHRHPFFYYYNYFLPVMMIALRILTLVLRSLKFDFLSESCWGFISSHLRACRAAVCTHQEHFNYYTMDAALGHLVFSMKYDVIGDQEHLRLMLRYNTTVVFTLVSLPFVYSHSLCLITTFDFAISHKTSPNLLTISYFFPPPMTMIYWQSCS